MTTNAWIETSLKIYTALLSLYPQEHRAEFGEPMYQVFRDQCRTAYEQKGRFGILLLWLRTLPDLGYTALLEHLTSPRAAWGLMEPVPNAPLPWKGVFLILLPGLVYLASQVAQLLTGETWYYFVYYRVTFFLIIPPLIAWGLTRRFPLWGLIPIGLFYRVSQEIGYQFIAWHPKLFSGNPFLGFILDAARQISKNLWLLIIPIVLATLLLVWRYARQHQPSRGFWLWLGTYLALVAITMAKDYAWLVQYAREMPEYFTEPTTFRDWFMLNSQWILYPSAALLLLTLIGIFFTHRHGFFAILILVGYILPTPLIGSQNFDAFPNPAFALTIFSAAILAYRAILILVAPIWMSRTASQTGKKRIVLASIAIALTIHAVAQFHPAMLYPANPDMRISTEWVMNTALEELKLISAFLLAIVMYQNAGPVGNQTAPNQAEIPEFTAEKA
jgi:hypothetical protein